MNNEVKMLLEKKLPKKTDTERNTSVDICLLAGYIIIVKKLEYEPIGNDLKIKLQEDVIVKGIRTFWMYLKADDFKDSVKGSLIAIEILLGNSGVHFDEAVFKEVRDVIIKKFNNIIFLE